MHLPLDFRSNFRELGIWYTRSHHIIHEKNGNYLMRDRGRSAIHIPWPVGQP